MKVPVEGLSLLCPTPAETDLLRACLGSTAAAREAWERWQRAVGDPEAAIRGNLSGVKALLPLLHYGLRHTGGTLDPGVRAALSSAALAERLRCQTYLRVCTRAFDALTAHRVPFLVLRGAALALSAYPDAALRHSHDVDLLLHAADISRAIQALQRNDFFDGTPYDRTGTSQMRDDSGLPLALHDRLFRVAYYSPPLRDMWTRAEKLDHDGRSVAMLSPADHLIHICGHAACSRSRDGLKWTADAWYLIERTPSLDWTLFVETVRASGLSLPLATMMRYLVIDLEARVPTWVLDELDSAATRADRPAREVALWGVRAGRRGTLRNLFAATHSWRGRLDLARWMALPSPVSLRLSEPLRYPRAWPLYYVTRPIAYGAHRVQRLGRPPTR